MIQGFDHTAVIVAGGSGKRMGSPVKKQFMALEGIPVLSRTLALFDSHEAVNRIILVVPEDDMAHCREKVISPFEYSTPVCLVKGGDTRQASVYQGLVKAAKISTETQKNIVLIHDGVRPFVPEKVINDCIHTARETGACIPVLELTDTIKQLDSDRKIEKTLDRSRLFRAQTPQAFRLDLILTAFDHARKTGFSGTDDASIMEHAGLSVSTVTGSPGNIKLTTPEDLLMARLFLETKI